MSATIPPLARARGRRDPIEIFSLSWRTSVGIAYWAKDSDGNPRCPQPQRPDRTGSTCAPQCAWGDEERDQTSTLDILLCQSFPHEATR